MKLDVATLEGILAAEKGISVAFPRSSLANSKTVRVRVQEMGNEDLADLCRWVNALKDAARVLRAAQVDLLGEER